MEYRRAKVEGGTFFFTVVTYNRHQFLCEEENTLILREAFRQVKQQYSFNIDAIAILPNHIHSIWTLPPGDSNFSNRWRLIKNYFTRNCDPKYKGDVSKSRQCKNEQAVWQRRFWEHQIKDDLDFRNHIDYIHYNPVKHGYVESPAHWKYSSFHHYVKRGIYDENWGAGTELEFTLDNRCE